MKTLDISQVFKTFEGEPFKTDGGADLTLKRVLLTYLASGSRMNLSHTEEGIAFEVGMLLGPPTGEVELEQDQYDVLKKLCDHGKIKEGQVEYPVYPNLVVSQQAKRMVDSAKTLEKPKK